MKKVDLGGVKCNTKAASKRRKLQNEEAERDGEDLGDVSYFQHRLPIELVEMILKLVLETDLKSALNARLVCQEWNHLLQDKLVYSGALMDKNISSFVNLDSSIVFKTFALGKLATSRIARVPTFRRLTNRKHTYDPELFQRSVNHLIIGGDAGTMLKMHVGKESLPYSLSSGFAEDHEVLVRVRESVSGADLINIIPQLRDVETLTISSIAFLSIPLMVLKKLDFSRFNTITKLDVCVGKSTDGFKMCLFLRKAEFPHLTDLYFRVYHSCVHFRAQGYYALSLAEYTDASLQLETYPNLREQLMEIKLEYMRVDCFVFNQRFVEAWSHLERDFIKSQQHLRSLELQVLLRSSSYRLDQLLPACESTLERLEVTANYYHPNVFNCSTISTFKKLEVCHIYQRNSLPPYTRWPTSDKLLRVCDLPRSIVNLHLAQLPKIVELKVLRRKLFKVERISYECRQMDMSSIDCFHFILEHLKFPTLTELRMYHCSCTEAMNILNKHDGIICFTEDVDCLIVLVDRSEFDYKTKMEYLIA